MFGDIESTILVPANRGNLQHAAEEVVARLLDETKADPFPFIVKIAGSVPREEYAVRLATGLTSAGISFVMLGRDITRRGHTEMLDFCALNALIAERRNVVFSGLDDLDNGLVLRRAKALGHRVHIHYLSSSQRVVRRKAKPAVNQEPGFLGVLSRYKGVADRVANLDTANYRPRAYLDPILRLHRA